eukprot:3707365-Pleurochrysis_carterae.AAC.2
MLVATGTSGARARLVTGSTDHFPRPQARRAVDRNRCCDARFDSAYVPRIIPRANPAIRSPRRSLHIVSFGRARQVLFNTTLTLSLPTEGPRPEGKVADAGFIPPSAAAAAARSQERARFRNSRATRREVSVRARFSSEAATCARDGTPESHLTIARVETALRSRARRDCACASPRVRDETLAWPELSLRRKHGAIARAAFQGAPAFSLVPALHGLDEAFWAIRECRWSRDGGAAPAERNAREIEGCGGVWGERVGLEQEGGPPCWVVRLQAGA